MQIVSTISHIFYLHLPPQILIILYVYSERHLFSLTSIGVPEEMWCATATSGSCELLHSPLPLA